MRGLTLACLWVGLFIGAALHFGWTDQFHLTAGAALLVLPGALFMWFRRYRAGDDTTPEEDLAPHPGRTLLIHGLCAMLCLGYLSASFHVLHAAGFGNADFDQDRVALEEKLQILEGAQQHDRVAELLQERLSQPISNAWEHALSDRLYQAFLKAGQQNKILQDRRQRFAKALEVARKYHLDGELARRLDEESQIEGDFLNRLTTLRGEKDWRTLASVLEAGLAEDAPHRRHLPLGTWLRDCLMDWSQELKDSNEKKAKLSRALEVCRKYGLDDHATRLALELLDREMRDRIRPTALPVGAKGGIVCVVSDYYPPAVITDLWIDSAEGRPVQKLRQKDFQVSWGGKQITDFAVHEENRDIVPMNFILAIDASGSMAGPAITAAENGAQTLLQGLHPLSTFHGQMWVKVLTFHSQISEKSHWTRDMLLASWMLKGIKAEGGTALYKTIMHSVQEFRVCRGHKHLLLFTDGKDTDGGPDVGSLISICKKEGVVISAIGLRSDDLDVAALRRLSSETGGTYAEADGPEHLLERFRQAGNRVRPHFYRLVLQPKVGMPGNLEIRVGGDNSLLLKGQ